MNLNCELSGANYEKENDGNISFLNMDHPILESNKWILNVVDLVKNTLTFLIIFHKIAVHINMKYISNEVYW